MDDITEFLASFDAVVVNDTVAISAADANVDSDVEITQVVNVIEDEDDENEFETLDSYFFGFSADDLVSDDAIVIVDSDDECDVSCEKKKKRVVVKQEPEEEEELDFAAHGCEAYYRRRWHEALR